MGSKNSENKLLKILHNAPFTGTPDNQRIPYKVVVSNFLQICFFFFTFWNRDWHWPGWREVVFLVRQECVWRECRSVCVCVGWRWGDAGHMPFKWASPAQGQLQRCVTASSRCHAQPCSPGRGVTCDSWIVIRDSWGGIESLHGNTVTSPRATSNVRWIRLNFPRWSECTPRGEWTTEPLDTHTVCMDLRLCLDY